MRCIQKAGCEWCNDLRNIEPANFIGLGDGASEKSKQILEDAIKNKNFITHFHDEEGNFWVGVVDKCPVCGYEFTEEDYDSYQDDDD